MCVCVCVLKYCCVMNFLLYLYMWCVIKYSPCVVVKVYNIHVVCAKVFFLFCGESTYSCGV